MKTVGFPISRKENEKRRALVFEDILGIKNKENLFFEKGYGNELGFSDEDLTNAGCNVVSYDEVIKKDIVVDPKIGDASYLDKLHNQIIFGWIHAVQNKDITDKIIQGKLTAYAWEDMYENGRHIFWRNNEIAGEAAIMHAFQHYGKMPYNTKVALIGRGNTAMGALKILTLLGADVTIYTRQTESLLKKEIVNYDVIVNAVLWDTNRKDHLVYRDDLKRLKKGAMIVDISCDRNGAIESSIPTTIDDPCYFVDGVLHYVVDHTPSLFYKTTTASISEQVKRFIDFLIEEKEDDILANSKCIENGRIIDQRINHFQNR